MMAEQDDGANNVPNDLLAQIGSAFVFLTRLPVPQSLFKDGFPPLQSTLWAFPLVGILVGLIGAAIITIANYIGLSSLLGVLLALVVMVMVTGGLHEDGLADVADGFGSHKQADEIAAIMKDSVIGSYGTIALILIFMIRAISLDSLTLDNQTSDTLATASYFAILPAAFAFSRAFVLVALITTPLSPHASLGKLLQKPEASPCIIALLICLMPVFFLPLGAVMTGGIAAVIGFIILRAMALRKIGGLTGDVMGATILITETGFLIGYISYV